MTCYLPGFSVKYTMHVDIPNITTTFNRQVIILQSRRPLTALSSAVVGGGLVRARFIINRHVDKNYNHPNPPADLRRFAGGLGITGPFIGMMTAAYLDGAQAVTLRRGRLAVAAVLTAGFTNPASAGVSPPVKLRPGTINIILLVDAGLAPAAMVNAVITATEAKTGVLQQYGVVTPEGHPATGTSTDSVVVACTGRGPDLPYAGPATPVGWLIGQSVRQALARALDCWNSDKE